MYSKSIVGYALISLSLILTGCLSGGGSSSGLGSGSFTLGITDAPVDGAEAVVVEFTGVEIQPANGDRITINYASPKSIDLLNLTGGQRDYLLDGQTLASGQYNWIRLKVNAEFDTVLDSYITLIGGAKEELRIPSGSQSGLKLNTPFTITDNGDVDFTIDFDLRKSVHKPDGQPGYLLRPALRLVDTNETGTISGMVNATLLADASCSASANSDSVYVFEGAGVTPDDVDGTDPEPVTSATVSLDGGGDYIYKAAFLEPGSYTVALTCQADLDEPDEDNAIVFAATADVSVSAGADTVQNF